MQVEYSLIQGCIDKDRRAQYRLYDECYAYLMRICYRYAKGREEAAELMNAGFLKVLINIEKYSTDKPFELWIRRIMINHIIDNFRTTKNYRESIRLEVDEMEEYKMVSLNTATSNLDVKDLMKIISTLPEMTRQVFNLFVVDGYNHKEIAELLSMSEGTSRWHLNNARTKMQEKISTDFGKKKSNES